MAVGYNQKEKRFLVRNSWGRLWGRAGAGLNFGEKRFPLDLKASIFEAPILETKYATVYPFSNPDGSWTWLDIKNPAGGIAKNIDSLTQDIKKGSGSIEKGQVVVVFGQATINEAIASSFKESERIRSLISQAEELPNSKAVLDALNAITIPDYLLDQHKAQITSQLIGLKARLSKEVEANSIKEALMSQINSATKASDITSEALTSPDYQVQQAAQEKLSNLIVQEEQAHQQELNKMREQNEKAQAQVARVQEEQAHQEFLKKIQEEEQKKAQAQLAQLQEKLLKIEAQVDKAQDDLAKASQEAITSQQEIEKLKAQQQETESRVAAQEEKNKTLETSLSNVNERLDKAEKRISGVENKVNDFKSYEKSWWQDQAGGWKTALYLLAAFGIGVAWL